MTARPIVVAIDGPAGSGKSSVSRVAAAKLGFELLDTGAAYRALTWFALERNIDVADRSVVVSLIDGLGYAMEITSHGTVVRLGSTDVTDAIREPRITAVVSDLAGIAEVRVRLNDMFRALIARTTAAGIVVEGRDITTVVAPDAQVRILLTAQEDVRAARRAAELGTGAAATAGELRERDRRDSQVVDFLAAAPGVTTIDSTDLDFDLTVQAVVDLIETARP
jgi:cytidylate kinase